MSGTFAVFSLLALVKCLILLLHFSVPEIKKDIVPINLDLVKDDDEETVKNEKSFELNTRKYV